MLIAQICLAECCMSWNAFIQVVGPVYINCYFGLSKIFSFSLFQGEYWRGTQFTSMQCASNYLCNTNPLFFQFFQLLSLGLNFCLCHDLVRTIKSPFSPASRRQSWYMAVSWVAPIIMVIIIHAFKAPQNHEEQCQSCLYQYMYLRVVNGTLLTGAGNYILSIAMSAYILMAIYSVIFAYRRLERPGVSLEVRKMFLRKHYTYVFVFIFIWTIQLSQNYYLLFNPQSQPVLPPASTQSLYDFRLSALDWLSQMMGFRGLEAQRAA